MGEPVTDGRDPTTGQFTTGNPGRPRGTRHKLTNAFLKALHEDFEAEGVAAIQAMRAEDPAAYVRVIAALVPPSATDEDGNPAGTIAGITVHFVRPE